MTEQKKEAPVQIEEQDLDAAQGGIGLLLPAVQKVRESAAPAPGPHVRVFNGRSDG